MATVKWNVFAPLVAPYVAGAAGFTIDAAVRQAAIDFCTRALVLQRTLAPVLTVANQAGYVLPLEGEVMAKLLHCRIGSEVAGLLTLPELDALQPAAGAPRAAYVIEGATTLYLHPVPTASGTPVVARVAVCPSQASTTVDAALFERYAAGIAAGAIDILCRTPGRAYSNADAAIDARGRFETAINRARTAAFYAHARSSPRASASYF